MYTFQIINSEFGLHYRHQNINVFFGNKKLTPKYLTEHFHHIKFQFLNQKHSTIVCSPDCMLDVADGFQWSDINFSAVIRTADCLPLIVFDHDTYQITNLHCGRKGLVDGILDNLLELTDISNSFSFFIGPHIQTYEIGEDLYNELSSKSIGFLSNHQGKFFFSLSDFTKSFISKHFEKFKIYETQINTLSDSSYWSYRANKNTPERNLSFAYIEEK